MDFRSSPKIELHLHLDCSLSYDFVAKYKGGLTFKQFEEDYALNQSCGDLSDFLARVPRSLELLQTQSQLTHAVSDVFGQLAADHVIYAELRFAPLLHVEQGLDPALIVETVCRAVKHASEQTQIHAGIILCTLRHFSAQQSLTTAQLASDFAIHGVVGFDLAADEAGYSLDAHVPAFEFAHRAGVSCTAHAGEAVGSESVHETLSKLQPQRIGHGVRAVEDPELVRFLAKSPIHLEVCPSCNVMINVFPSLQNHSVDRLSQAGVSVGINTDGRTIPLLNLSGEYHRLHETFAWQPMQFLTCNLNALDAAFCTPNLKDELKPKLIAAYQAMA